EEERKRERESLEHSSKLDVSIKSLPSELREPHRRSWGDRGDRTPGEQDLKQPSKKAHMNSQSLKQLTQDRQRAI
ncbi:mCG144609, partial [Mus musculus]